MADAATKTRSKRNISTEHAKPGARKKPTFNNPTGAVDGNTNKDAGTWWHRGALGSNIPLPPGCFIETASTERIRFAVNATLHTGHVALVDGEFGVGKTTAVVEAARSHAKVEAVYVNMFGVTSPRDALAIINRALTGEVTRKGVTAAQLREDLIDLLADRTVLLIVDDAHYLKTPSLETLLALWNRVHNDTRKGVPMVFIGNNLVKHLGAHIPELVSRSALTVECSGLNAKTVVDFIIRLEPGIEGTDRDMLVGLNQRFRGQLRNWDKFFRMAEIYRRTDRLSEPLTTTDLDFILPMLTEAVSAPITKGQKGRNKR